LKKSTAFIVLLVVLGAFWFLFRTKPEFDLDRFESQVRQLATAANVAKKMADKGQVPDYLQTDIDYLNALKEILVQRDLECEQIVEQINAHFIVYQEEKKDNPDALSLKDIESMDPAQRREAGMRIVAHLGPAWYELLEPVKEFCAGCPEESKILELALGTLDQSKSETSSPAP
jgi:hypothetical protein